MIMNLNQNYFKDNNVVKYQLRHAQKIKIRNGHVDINGGKLNFFGNFGNLNLSVPNNNSDTFRINFAGNLNMKILPFLYDNIEISTGNVIFKGYLASKSGEKMRYFVDFFNEKNRKLSLGIKGMRPTIKDIVVSGNANNRRLRIKRGNATKGGGTFYVKGDVFYDGVSNSVLTIKSNDTKFDFETKILKTISTEMDMDIVVKGKKAPYDVLGEVNLNSVNATKDFSVKKEILNLIRRQDISSVAVGKKPFLNFNVAIKAKKSINVKNRSMDFLMSSDLKLIGDSSQPNLTGILVIDKGKFIFRREFRVEKGNISFDQNSKFDPTLDIVAVSDISSRRITMNITGRSSNANVDLTADPATDDSNNVLKKWDILVLLTTGKLPKNSSGSLATQTLSILASPLENELEKLFAYSGQNFIRQIYLDFEVSDTTGNLVPKLIVPVTISDDVSFNVEVDQERSWELSSDYSVNENIFVSGSVVGSADEDDKSKNNSAVIPSSNSLDAAFDLNFRYNFK